MFFVCRVKKTDKNWKKKCLPTHLSYYFWAYKPHCHTLTYFIPLNQYGRPKNKPKCLNISPILFNFNQFNNCSFFLTNYFITLFSCLSSKSNFCQSVCLTMCSPILLLKSWSWYMYLECPKKLWVRTAVVINRAT